MSNAVHREQDQTIELKWDQEAMEWMQDKVKGSPVILEAHLDQYHWGARFANYTGLPLLSGGRGIRCNSERVIVLQYMNVLAM